MPGKSGGKNAKEQTYEKGEHWAIDTKKLGELQKLHKALRIPPSPGYPLEVEEGVPENPGLILVVRDFFTPEECDVMINVMERIGLNPSSKSDTNPKKGEAFLDRFNLTFTDPDLSRNMWQRLAPLLPPFEGRPAAGFCEKLRYYCYTKGQRFGEHVDVAVKERGLQSEYTVLLYLNSQGEHDLVGGETVFHATKKKVLLSFPPQKG
eukprot:Sspe_Gene.98992::Locus_72398_Transcript_1_1_Confidence_1.000_Length_647::g.98992::m.98992